MGGKTLEEKINMEKMKIIDCDRMDYLEALKLQKKLQEKRKKDEILNTALLVEHNPVYTLGKDPGITKEALIKNELPAPVIDVNRGGKITYHGPGQLVVYLIHKIPRAQIGEFLDTVEDLTIAALREYGIVGYSRKDELDTYEKNIRGVWCKVDEVHKKIAAIGMELKDSGTNAAGEKTAVTMHGFALNVNTDLSFFDYIHPCGFNYNVMSSMAEVLNKQLPLEGVKETVGKYLGQFLNEF